MKVRNESRFNRIARLMYNGHTQSDIMLIEKISRPTAARYMKEVKEEIIDYDTRVAEKALKDSEKLQASFFVKFDKLIANSTDVRDNVEECKSKIERLLDRFLPAIKFSESEMKQDKKKRKQYDDREGQRKNLREEFTELAISTARAKLSANKAILEGLREQAKLCGFGTSKITQINNQQIKMKSVRLTFMHKGIKEIINTFVSEDKKGLAWERLKDLNEQAKNVGFENVEFKL